MSLCDVMCRYGGGTSENNKIRFPVAKNDTSLLCFDLVWEGDEIGERGISAIEVEMGIQAGSLPYFTIHSCPVCVGVGVVLSVWSSRAHERNKRFGMCERIVGVSSVDRCGQFAHPDSGTWVIQP